MFTWICQQCGREVPPSYSECPTCAERKAAGQPVPPAPPPPQAQPPQAQQPQWQPPPPAQGAYPQQAYPPQPPYPQQQAYPQQPYPQQPQYPQQQPYPQQPYPPQAAYPQQPSYVIGENNKKKGMPPWLVLILVFAVLGGAFYGLYRYTSGDGAAPADAQKAQLQTPTKADGSPEHPYAKYIEVTGLRLLEDKNKKPVLKFSAVNHSAADMAGLELLVTLTSTAAREGDLPITVIQAKVGEIPAFGIKEIETPIKTNLRAYELPDWQFLKTKIEITSPK